MATDEHNHARPTIDEIRARMSALPSGLVSSEDLRRVGVTEEQFSELADADGQADFWRYHSERESHLEFMNAHPEWVTTYVDDPAPDRGEEAKGQDYGPTGTAATRAASAADRPPPTSEEVEEAFGGPTIEEKEGVVLRSTGTAATRAASAALRPPAMPGPQRATPWSPQQPPDQQQRPHGPRR